MEWLYSPLKIKCCSCLDSLASLKASPMSANRFSSRNWQCRTAHRETPFNGKALAIDFKSKEVRSAAFDYFGHMWSSTRFMLPLLETAVK